MSGRWVPAEKITRVTAADMHWYRVITQLLRGRGRRTCRGWDFLRYEKLASA